MRELSGGIMQEFHIFNPMVARSAEAAAAASNSILSGIVDAAAPRGRDRGHHSHDAGPVRCRRKDAVLEEAMFALLRRPARVGMTPLCWPCMRRETFRPACDAVHCPMLTLGNDRTDEPESLRRLHEDLAGRIARREIRDTSIFNAQNFIGVPGLS